MTRPDQNPFDAFLEQGIAAEDERLQHEADSLHKEAQIEQVLDDYQAERLWHSNSDQRRDKSAAMVNDYRAQGYDYDEATALTQIRYIAETSVITRIKMLQIVLEENPKVDLTDYVLELVFDADEELEHNWGMAISSLFSEIVLLADGTHVLPERLPAVDATGQLVNEIVLPNDDNETGHLDRVMASVIAAVLTRKITRAQSSETDAANTLEFISDLLLKNQITAEQHRELSTLLQNDC